jgi:hypothetical protein
MIRRRQVLVNVSVMMSVSACLLECCPTLQCDANVTTLPYMFIVDRSLVLSEMSTPGSFHLEPANPAYRPGPAPPRYLKRQIYNDPSVFKHIDDHAINVSSRLINLKVYLACAVFHVISVVLRGVKVVKEGESGDGPQFCSRL